MPTCYQCTVRQGNTLFIPTGDCESVVGKCSFLFLVAKAIIFVCNRPHSVKMTSSISIAMATIIFLVSTVRRTERFISKFEANVM